MRLTEKGLRSLSRKILKELFTKKRAYSSKEFLGNQRGSGGYDSSTFGYDEIGFDDGFADDGGFGESDTTDTEQLEDLSEDENDVE